MKNLKFVVNPSQMEERKKDMTSKMQTMKTSNNQDSELRQLYVKIEDLSEEKKRLSAVMAITTAIANELNLDTLLLKIIKEVKKTLQADRCTIFLLDEEKNELWSKLALGLEEMIRFPADKGLAGEVCKTGKILNIPDAYKDNRFNPEIDKKTGYKTRSILSLPIQNKFHETIGVFQVLNKVEGPFTKQDEDLLVTISNIAAISIENAQLYEEQKKSFISFVETLSAALDTRDYITAGHSRRVTLYALEIGRLIKLNPHTMEVLRYAALLHDIGKIGIPEVVLFKDRRLTEDEYEIIKGHAQLTKNILKKIHFQKKFKDTVTIAATHHERVNGTGYPEGLTGEQIPLGGKILAVADVFDAVTSRRQHQDRMDLEKVMEVLDSETGASFEPFVVYNFKLIPLNRLIKILEYGHTDEIDPKDLDKLKDYTLREIVSIRNKSTKTNDELEIENIFMRYYLRQYRTQ
jgi:putative nucleotidyltransferase with HDIG domain